MMQGVRKQILLGRFFMHRLPLAYLCLLPRRKAHPQTCIRLRAIFRMHTQDESDWMGVCSAFVEVYARAEGARDQPSIVGHYTSESS